MKKILLIENDTDLLEKTAAILGLANYTVVTAVNGKEGVEQAYQQQPDIIISSLGLPVLDGYGVLHLIRRHPETHNTPFIFISSHTDRAAIRKAMEAGADDFITKPFEETELLNAIECRIKKAEEVKTDIGFKNNAKKRAEKTPVAAEQSEVLSSFIANRNIEKYNKHQLIYREGERPHRIYYIIKGKVKVTKTHVLGKELVVDLYGNGEFLGYHALLQDTNYTDTAETIDTTELAIIPRTDFEELLLNDAHMARTFLTMLSAKITQNENHLVALAYNSLRKKVAEALLQLQHKYKEDIHLSRENLASVAGTATESLIRTLTDFRHEGLITINEKGCIKIIQLKKLEELAG